MRHDAQRPLSVLLLAADSGEGTLGEMLDPRLRELFCAAGIHCQACYVSDLKPGYLDFFHCVVLLRTPVPQHPFGDEADFREKSQWLHDFVERGGGLFLMFTECYGKTESTLNELCAPWGLRFFFNRLVSDGTVPAERFPRLYESTLLEIPVVSPAILPLPFSTLKIVTEGGHGTQHLTCVPEPGSPWQPILRGGPHITSQSYGTFYINSSRETIPDPILCAARGSGRGRVMAFPGSAPFWLTNSHIWRFQGLLQEQNDRSGLRFFCDAWRWLADTERGRRLSPDSAARAASVMDKAWLNKPEQFSFQPVSAEDQARLMRSTAQKIWLGNHDLTPARLSALASRLEASGYRTVFPLGHYENMTEASWTQLRTDCQPLCHGEFSLRPGYELHDNEGVISAVVSPSTFPRHTANYPNSTLLENVWIAIFGCMSILRHPLTNRIPPQRYGGYNLIEWDSSETWFTLYKQMVASKYFISPVAFNAAPDCEALNTWVLVPEGRNAFDMLRTNKHATFISDGPILERFAWQGPGLINDEWEGHWYGYVPGDTAEVSFALRSSSSLTEVVLYDGEEVLARFTPGTPHFEKRLKLQLWRDVSLHLTGLDGEGRRLYATFPLYTRNFRFWGHVGSDQMNNYVNAMSPSPTGYLGVGHELHDMFGFVTLGAAWGDYLRMTPSLSYAEFMPRQEVSGIIGSLNVHHPSALISDTSGHRHALNDHRRVFPFCGADAQVFRSRIAGEQRDNDEGLREVWHGRTTTPTRLFSHNPDIDARDEYVIWRWAVNQPICVEVRKHFRVPKETLSDPWFTFASNSHWNLPGLFIRSMRHPEERILIADAPVISTVTPPGKEWDNSYFLRMANLPPSATFSPGGSGELEIGTGGAGTFGLIPLGPPRDSQARLWVTPKEVQVFFDCKLSQEERDRGVFTIAYLVIMDATETSGSPFGAIVKGIQQTSENTRGKRRFSITLDMSGKSFPLDLDLDRVLPGCVDIPLYLELSGVPAGTIELMDAKGQCVRASQPQGGRSWHIVPPGLPRRYTLVTRPTWKECAS